MKKLLVCTFALGSMLLLSAQKEVANQTITVIIENVLNDEGSLLAGLHTADTFMKSEAVQGIVEVAKKGEVTLTFENVAPGAYAIVVLHDKNDNKRMDYQSNGMPLEAWATSGSSISFGPPRFEECKFVVLEEPVQIKMRF